MKIDISVEDKQTKIEIQDIPDINVWRNPRKFATLVGDRLMETFNCEVIRDSVSGSNIIIDMWGKLPKTRVTKLTRGLYWEMFVSLIFP